MVLRKTFKNFTAVASVAVTSVSMAFVPYVPGGGSEVKNAGNVKIYKNSAGDHVQVLNISGGAKVSLVYEYQGYLDLPTKYQPGKKYAFKRLPLKTWWNTYYPSPVFVVNGQFFDPNKKPNTFLSFPVRANYAYAEGYDIGALGNNARQLEINSHAVDVFPFNVNRVKNGPNPFVISGYHPDGNFPRPNAFIWRTVLCARYVGGNSPWLMYVGILKEKDRAGLKQVMSSWGCDIQNKTLVLDGGGSTGLVYQYHGRDIFVGDPEHRAIPNAIVVHNNGYKVVGSAMQDFLHCFF